MRHEVKVSFCGEQQIPAGVFTAVAPDVVLGTQFSRNIFFFTPVMDYFLW